jgi:hypothetical protein
MNLDISINSTGRYIIQARYTDPSGALVEDSAHVEITPQPRPGIKQLIELQNALILPSTRCWSLDLAEVGLNNTHNGWVIKHGEDVLLDFGAKQADGIRALELMNHHHIDFACAGDPGHVYLMATGSSSPLEGEDCTGFDPGELVIRENKGNWEIVDMGTIIMSFDTRDDAKTAYNIISKYRYDRICFIDRPNESMIYFRVRGPFLYSFITLLMTGLYRVRRAPTGS